MEHVDLHLGGGELDERVGKSLDRAVDVALYNYVEFLERAERLAACDIVKGQSLRCAQPQLALQLLALVGDFAGFLLGVEHREGVAGGRRSVEAENQRGLGRSGLLYALVALVEHRLDFTVVSAGEDDVALAESAVLHQYSGHISAAFVER